MNDVSSVSMGDFENMLVGAVSQTVSYIGQFGELTLHGAVPARSPPYSFLHHTMVALDNAT